MVHWVDEHLQQYGQWRISDPCISLPYWLRTFLPKLMTAAAGFVIPAGDQRVIWNQRGMPMASPGACKVPGGKHNWEDAGLADRLTASYKFATEPCRGNLLPNHAVQFCYRTMQHAYCLIFGQFCFINVNATTSLSRQVMSGLSGNGEAKWWCFRQFATERCRINLLPNHAEKIATEPW